MTINRSASFWQVAKRWSTLLLLLGTTLIIASGIGLWIEWTLLSESGFVRVSTDTLRANETRETLASAIFDRIFEGQPVLQALIRGPIEGVIAGLLGSSLLNNALAIVSELLWEMLFLGRDRVILDIAPLRDFVYAIITGVAPDAAQSIRPEQLPAELVLIDGDAIPDLGSAASAASWISIFAFIAGIGLIAAIVGRAWADQALRAGHIVWTGLFLIFQAIIVTIATFPIRSTLVLAIDNAAGRSLVGTTYGILVLRLYVILFGLSAIGRALVAHGLWTRGLRVRHSHPA